VDRHIRHRQAFHGQVLTLGEYEVVESRYLAAAESFAMESRVDSLTAVDVQLSPVASTATEALTEGARFDLQQAFEVLRLELRGEVSCRLEAERFYVHTGFDLTLYVGSDFSCPEAIKTTEGLGLSVEEGILSPYFSGE